MEKVPTHVGLIMDGNRRWAKAQSMDVVDGHFAGIKRVRPIVETAKDLGISFLTFYALSEDNLLRDPREVTALMQLFREFFSSTDMQELINNGVRINVIGRYQKLPKDIVKRIDEVREETKNNKAITANFALVYDGANEILDTAQKLIDDKVKKVTQKAFVERMYTHGQTPDADLIVRTGGETRLSGFLLWQAKYAELRFISTFWPDYHPENFKRDIVWYQERERRFGR